MITESAQMLKANRRLEGKPCGWCQRPLVLGEDAAVCSACHGEHHAVCWSERAGCCREGCLNAPLAQLSGDQAGSERGHKTCHNCAKAIPERADVCTYCNAVVTPDGLWHGPKTIAPGAVSSLVCGIIGLVLVAFAGFMGALLGAGAISESSRARRRIRSDARAGGGALAIIGLILGIIDIFLGASVLYHLVTK